jgi:hypothetical protein
MATENPLSTGIFVARRQPESAPAAGTTPAPVELIGHVKFVERNAPTNLDGMRVLIELRDPPGVTVALVTRQLRLQALIDSALASGNLIACLGARLAAPPAPRGRNRAVEVYSIDGVILYSSP